MKKVLLLASVAVLALSSCKKEYTCECEVAGISTSVESGVKLSKKDAEAWCETTDYCSLK